MARTLKTLTAEWEQIASNRCSVTVDKAPDHSILHINDTATDETADSRLVEAGDMVFQMDYRPTYAKGAGIVVIVDEV